MWDKLKREWKTFVVAVVTTSIGGWQIAVGMGANIQDLFSWVPSQYKTGVLFIVGSAMLLLRKYTDNADPE